MKTHSSRFSSTCVSCGEPATAPTNRLDKNYCEVCWQRRCVAVESEERRFGFWRIMRGSDFEAWGISHPDATGNPGGKIGEAWLVHNAAARQVCIVATLEPCFAWNTPIPLHLGTAKASETYAQVLATRLIGFFEGSFPSDSTSVELRFLNEERVAVQVE